MGALVVLLLRSREAPASHGSAATARSSTRRFNLDREPQPEPVSADSPARAPADVEPAPVPALTLPPGRIPPALLERPLIPPVAELGAGLPWHHGAAVRSIVFDERSETLWSAAIHGTVIRWRVADGERLASWRAHERLQGLARCGERIVSAGDATLRGWSGVGELLLEVVLPSRVELLAAREDGGEALAICQPLRQDSAPSLRLDEEGFPELDMERLMEPEKRGYLLVLVDLQRGEITSQYELAPGDLPVAAAYVAGRAVFTTMDTEGLVHGLTASGGGVTVAHVSSGVGVSMLASDPPQRVLAGAGRRLHECEEYEAAGSEPCPDQEGLLVWQGSDTQPWRSLETTSVRAGDLAIGAGLFFSCGQDTLEVWDVSTRTLRASVPAHEPRAVVTSPNGALAAWSEGRNGDLVLLDLTTLRPARASADPASPRAPPGGLSFRPHANAELLAADQTGRVLLWSLPTGQVVRSWETGLVTTALAWRPDGGAFAFAGRDQDRVQRLSVYSLTDEDPRLLADLDEAAIALGWDPAGSLIAASSFGRRVALFDSQTGALRWERQLKGKGTATRMAFTRAGGELLLSGGFGRLEVLDVASGELLRDLRTWKDADVEARFDPAGGRIVIHGKGRVQVRSYPDGRELLAFQAAADWLAGAIPLPGDLLLTGEGRRAVLALWQGDQCLARFGGRTGLIHFIEVSPDGRWAVAGGLVDTELTVWDLTAR